MRVQTLSSVVVAGAGAAILFAAAAAPPMARLARPPVQTAGLPEQPCDSPLVDEFEGIGIAALELSELAHAVPMPLAGSPAAATEARAAVGDLAQRAVALDRRIMRLRNAVVLSPREALLAQSLGAHAGRLRQTATEAESFLEPSGELDAALARSLDALVEQAWRMERLVVEAALCSPAPTFRQAYAHVPECRTLDPEYELALHGSCNY